MNTTCLLFDTGVFLVDEVHSNQFVILFHAIILLRYVHLF